MAAALLLVRLDADKKKLAWLDMVSKVVSKNDLNFEPIFHVAMAWFRCLTCHILLLGLFPSER